mmetsp:Transcript_67025/g.195992  ORF Transcript_67025/g.195992 Transcript_67025/m.195992 type:complete len:378 (+) Transcript_67025:94-1227(+)
MARLWMPPWALGTWCLFLGLCACGCAGLRTKSGAERELLSNVPYPEGPKEKPVGRHIQYIWMNQPHGLTDRIRKYMRPLFALGNYHNATVHIKGGAHGAQLWLDGSHSEEVAESWGRYFNTWANGGNPWHELVNFRGCKIVDTSEEEVDMLALFDDGALCVNFISEIRIWQKPGPMLSKDWDLPVSNFIKMDAAQFLKRYAVEEAYGSVHIRRCDRLGKNQNCTDPNQIFKQIAKAKQIKTWLFFMYAEEGYREKLSKRLKPLGVKLLFEDEAVLNDRFPKDNYYTYLLGKYLNGGAQVILETHMCHGDSVPDIIDTSNGIESHGIFLPRITREDVVEDAYEAVEEEYSAVCGNAAKGARLLMNKTKGHKHSSTRRP